MSNMSGRRPPPSRLPSHSQHLAPPVSPWTPPLLLTIRFSTSLPDLHLDIPAPSQTTVVALKHLIRSRLSEPDSQRRLRFIHQGKILPDAAALGSVLRPVPPPPPSSPGSRPSSSHADPKGKGKAIEGAGEPRERTYVNCSIGDSLTDEELREEARAALEQPRNVAQGRAGRDRTPDGRYGEEEGQPGGGTGIQTPRRPRGFDRLLSAGFTPAEVNQLRLQFQSIQAVRHTPDTMPSPDTLRSMEERWIDSNAADSFVGGGGGGVAGEGGGTVEMEADGLTLAGMLDLMIPGMIVGFFWPLASICWLVREEGLWSRGWRAFITIGFIFSVTIGIVRALAGDKS